jgi:lysozyme
MTDPKLENSGASNSMKFMGIGILFCCLCIGTLIVYPPARRNIKKFISMINFGVNNTRTPKGFPIHGIDVSIYQLWIDWETVSEQNLIKFAFIKATEGENHVDKAFKRNWRKSKQYGIKRGAYHFFRQEKGGRVQALNYLSTVDFEKGDLAPVLDIEVFNGGSKVKWYQDIDTWLQIVEAKTGKKPIIYSGVAFYRLHLESRYRNYPVWVANYNRKKLRSGLKWHFWQHTDRAKIKGITGLVDHNVFNGPEIAMNELSF